MFRGATVVHLDSKARLAIPTRYRDILMGTCHGQMICTIDVQQPCLLLYPLSEWELIEQRLSKLSSMHSFDRRIQRLLLGYAHECQLDKFGRLLLTNTLRQHANLQKQIMFVGQLNKFEIWDQQMWYQQIKEDIAIEQKSMDLLPERLQDFSL